MFWLLAAAMFDGCMRRKLPGSFGRRLLLVISFWPARTTKVQQKIASLQKKRPSAASNM